jgi:TolA-binding protein
LEIELLKKQLEDQTKASKSKESRMQMTHDRLTRKIHDLEKQNRDLEGNIRLLEQDRMAYVELKKKLQEESQLKKSQSLEAVNIKYPKLSEIKKTVKARSPDHRRSTGSIPSSSRQNSDPTILNAVAARATKKAIAFDHVKADLDKLACDIGLAGVFEVIQVFM